MRLALLLALCLAACGLSPEPDWLPIGDRKVSLVLRLPGLEDQPAWKDCPDGSIPSGGTVEFKREKGYEAEDGRIATWNPCGMPHSIRVGFEDWPQPDGTVKPHVLTIRAMVGDSPLDELVVREPKSWPGLMYGPFLPRQKPDGTWDPRFLGISMVIEAVSKGFGKVPGNYPDDQNR
jgi:hypothetical protein